MLFAPSRIKRWTFVAAIASLGIAQGVAAAPAMATSRPSGPPGYSYAASEGHHFTIKGYADVAYGVDGKFYRKTHKTGRISCSNSTFGDPKKGRHKYCYTLKLEGPEGYSYADTENGHFTISGLADVAYGANGVFNRKTAMSGHVHCDNATFGDPLKKVHKSCFILTLAGPKGYSYAGPQNAHISFAGVADVAFGSNGNFKYKSGVTGGIDCTNDVFGNPDPGVQKACYLKPVAAVVVGPVGFSYVATEGGAFDLVNSADVAYGANGFFVLKTGLKGHISCNNSTFGDPIHNVSKACFVRTS